jgi:hypothetical protein
MPARSPLPSLACQRWPFLAALAALAAVCGCAAPGSLQATTYDVRVQLDPPTHGLNGQTVVSLQREPPYGLASGPITVEFALNRALNVTSLNGHGVKVREHTRREPDATKPATEPDTTALLAIHRLVLDAAEPECTLTFEYSGALVQDVQAGEKRGQIHNLMMAAHISNDGIFLDENGGWYPQVYHDPAHAQGALAAYRLTVDPVSGMQLVAGADPDGQASQRTGKLAWKSKYPLTGLVLVGGAHQVKEQDVGPIHVELHYSVPTDEQSRAAIEKNTDLFLAAAGEYLQRYTPLIGPYPFARYTIVENFFSSGFAFPEFTLLNKVLLQMGPRALMHGYLDHEMLHSWWGNTVYVDPADGDWCEALTSYCANYYGYVADGDEPGARSQRRNCCVGVSRLKPEEHKPLGKFNRPDGPGRDIGYGKGAMVFYMLSRQIGQDTFWATLRQLTRDYTGKFANWQTLQRVFEQQSGANLERFFRDWVRADDTPRLELQRAAWRDRDGVLDVTLTQGSTAFALAVPLRIVHADGSTTDETANLATPTATVHLHLKQPPTSVILDPDYQVLRQLRPEEIIPSGATTRADHKLLIVKPAGPLSPFYERVIEDFTGQPGSKEVTQSDAADVTPAELARQSVLILGDAVQSPPVAAFLARAKCPLHWLASGFALDGVVYAKTEQAVLCTVHHPDLPEAGVTIYRGHSETALGRSDLLGFYRDSLVVFETTSREVDGKPVYECHPTTRKDFESPQSLAVTK